jgi:hypothetical protein
MLPAFMYMKTLGLDNLSGYQITMSHFVLEQLHASLSRIFETKLLSASGFHQGIPMDGQL